MPANLRELAGIKEDVVFLGCGKYCEIWSKEQYEAHESSISQEEISKIAEEMLSGGFTF